MELRIVRLLKVGFNSTTHEMTNQKSLKTNLFHMYYIKLLHDKFSHQEKENNISYTNIPKIRIYLNIFISFFIFPHNSQILLP